MLISNMTANAISTSTHSEILSAMNFSWKIHECITLRRQTGNSPKGGRIQRETMLSFNSTVLVWWRTTKDVWDVSTTSMDCGHRNQPKIVIDEKLYG